jgi:hypothetical protein
MEGQGVSGVGTLDLNISSRRSVKKLGNPNNSSSTQGGSGQGVPRTVGRA